MEDNNLKMNKLISIVVPVYNEDENILILYKKIVELLLNNDYEIIFVNDGSNDKSKSIILDIIKKSNRVKLIDFSRNFGHEAATTAGVEYANGDAVVVIDADLQDPPELITDMIKLWLDGYEVVYAVRDKRKGESFFKKSTANIFYKVLENLSDIKIPRNTGDFRLMDRRVVDDFKKLKEKNRFFRGLISWLGYKQIGISFHRNKRYKGKTKYNYFKLFKLAFDSVTSFSTKLLSFITFIGFFIAVFSFVLGVYFIFQKLILKFPVEGWTSLAVIILFFSGFQIFLIGIVGEYLSRMFIEVKNRPLYLIREIIDRSKKIDNN